MLIEYNSQRKIFYKNTIQSKIMDQHVFKQFLCKYYYD